ncbi:MAG: Gfo/Idh/MocA family oxidoreductase [Peptococcaceae bacterium]|nr:Gfo/Idh/MocA family oxidoreductase [Peptococcaceae bacterium]
MQKPLKIGFIGGGVNSAVGYTHFAASQMDGRWVLQAGCFSRDNEQNAMSAYRYGVPDSRRYPTWQEMLSDERGMLDAVAVLLPTPSHFSIVRECLSQNIPVICEKSLAMDHEQGIQLMDICQQKNSFLAVTYNYSGYPMVRELRNQIRNNSLGRILHFQIEMPQEGFIRVDAQGNRFIPQQWRLEDGKIPTIYLDLASHIHYLVHYLIDEKPLEVMAIQSSNGWFTDIVDNVSAICNYTNGIQGQIWFSKSAIGNRNGLRIRIYGSQGSAEWIQANPEEMLLSYADGTRKIIDRGGNTDVAGSQRYTRFKSGHPAGFIEAFANLYCDIADALSLYQKEGGWSSGEVFGAELACEGLRFVEAMHLSAISRKMEEV